MRLVAGATFELTGKFCVAKPRNICPVDRGVRPHVFGDRIAPWKLP